MCPISGSKLTQYLYCLLFFKSTLLNSVHPVVTQQNGYVPKHSLEKAWERKRSNIESCALSVLFLCV